MPGPPPGTMKIPLSNRPCRVRQVLQVFVIIGLGYYLLTNADGK